MFPAERKSMVQPEQCNQAVPGGQRAPPLKLLGLKPARRRVPRAAGAQPASLCWPSEGRRLQLWEMHPPHLNSGGLPPHRRRRQGWGAAGPLLQEPFVGPPLRGPRCRTPFAGPFAGPPLRKPLCRTPFTGALCGTPIVEAPLWDPRCRTPFVEAGAPGGSQVAPQLSAQGADTVAEALCKAPGALGSSLSVNRGERRLGAVGHAGLSL